MPTRHLDAFVSAMPHVRSIASMRDAEAVSVGTGALKKADRESVVSRWQGEVRRAARRAQTPEQLAAAAASSGLAFVRVPAPRKDAS